MNNKVLSAAALLVMSVASVAHAGDHPSNNGQRGTVNFSGAITAQTCDSGIIVGGNNVAFVELPVITTTDFTDLTGASESSEAAVKFGIAPIDLSSCTATSASLSLTGKTIKGKNDVLENTLDVSADPAKATGVGVQVLFADGTTSLLNQGYVTPEAGTNFTEADLMVNLEANYFKTGAKAQAGLVSSVAHYQIAYL